MVRWVVRSFAFPIGNANVIQRLNPLCEPLEMLIVVGRYGEDMEKCFKAKRLLATKRHHNPCG
jgi:hypothetical protein